jgi:SagB-type dehydrogenase family enzyme
MDDVIILPPAKLSGGRSLNESIARRRSERSFLDDDLPLDQIGQVLWAVQGREPESGLRTVPSAGATYPLEIYTVQQSGVYHYDPRRHLLDMKRPGDLRKDLYQAALEQEFILEAPLIIVIAAVYERTSRRYGAARTPRYVHMEVGHAAQNVLLQCAALGLGSVPVGAFHDEVVRSSLGFPPDHEPLYLLPIGRTRK